MNRLGEIHSIVTADGKYMFLPSSGVKLIAYGNYGAPPVKFNTRKLHLQDGVTELNYTVEPRNIPVRMFKDAACSRQEYWNNRLRLHEFFRPNRNGKLKLNVILPTGDVRTLDVRADPGMEFQAQTEDNSWYIDETLNFVAFNPIWYNPTEKEAHTSGFYGTDLVFSASFPIEFGPEGLQFVSQINYLGTWRTYPTIKIDGPYSSVLISNETTGKEITLDVPIGLGEKRILTLNPGETSIVDENGNYCFGDLGPTSDLMDFTIKPVPEVPEGSNEGPYYQATQNYVPIRYYRHGEPDGESQAIDFGTDKVTGIYYGGYTLDNPGPLGEDVDTSVYFDGTGADVDIETIDFSGTSYTFEFFLRPGTQTGDAAIITVTYDGGTEFVIYLTTDGRLTVLNDALDIQTAAGSVPSDVWTHCVVTFALSSGVTHIVLNGILNTSGLIGAIGADVTSVVMGIRTAGTYVPYVGYQDEFAIYLRSFTASELLEKYSKTIQSRDLYAVGGKQIIRTTLLGSEGSGYFNSADSLNAARYYRLGDVSGTLASDSGVDGVYGTYEGGFTLRTAGAITGDSNTAVTFDGVNGRVVLPGLELSYRSFTLIAWIKPATTPPAAQGIFGAFSAYAIGESTYLQVRNDGSLYFSNFFDDLQSAAGLIPFGSWTHVAMIYNLNTGDRIQMINGAVVAQNTAVSSYVASNPICTIGSDEDTQHYFKGDIDEFMFLNGALTPTQVYDLYQSSFRRYSSDVVITYNERFYGI